MLFTRQWNSLLTKHHVNEMGTKPGFSPLCFLSSILHFLTTTGPPSPSFQTNPPHHFIQNESSWLPTSTPSQPSPTAAQTTSKPTPRRLVLTKCGRVSTTLRSRESSIMPLAGVLALALTQTTSRLAMKTKSGMYGLGDSFEMKLTSSVSTSGVALQPYPSACRATVQTQLCPRLWTSLSASTQTTWSPVAACGTRQWSRAGSF